MGFTPNGNIIDDQASREQHGRNMYKMERQDENFAAIMGTTNPNKMPKRGGNKTESGYSGMGSSAAGKKYAISSKKGGIGPLDNDDDASWEDGDEH